MMRIVKTFPEDSVFEWIRSERAKPKAITGARASWPGNFVSLLIPNTFEAYAKILHRIDARYEDPTSPLSESEIAILKIAPCTPLKELVEHTRENSQGSRIRWARIAELLDVPIKPEICHEWFRTKLEPGCWPRFLWGPAEGTLASEEVTELASILMPLTHNDQECFFRFPEIPFISTE